MSHRPISDYALLSDLHSAALTSRDGSIDWLCFPRFDQPSIFGRLLDDEAGHWSIRPAGEYRVRRRYHPGTLVLETRFESEAGAVVLDDLLATGANERGHELGAEAPHTLIRRVRGLKGRMTLEIVYEPRPEYGIIQPLLVPSDEGILARGGAVVLHLSSPVGLEIVDSSARAEVTVERDQELTFALQYRSSAESSPESWRPGEIDGRIGETLRAWESWSATHQKYDGPWKELVHHSGRVLQGLTYFPTGAMVAAPTTSLPEVVGGSRNWDYRFCWIRDASFTLDALWVAACPDEAAKFFSFMAGAAASHLRREAGLQIVFGVLGEHDLTERELPHLRGWRHSAPVRIGNGAWSQTQLDVYGELLGSASLLRKELDGMDEGTRSFLAGAVDGAAARWNETDHGIWEIRDRKEHFLFSKLMCWVALDRGIMLSEFLNVSSERVQAWEKERHAVREAILTDGWRDRAGAFTQSFGSEDLDASSLVMPIVGFLPADDPRMRATIETIASQLVDERGLVRRYRSDDHMDGEEGSFLLCTFWLAQALALAGELDRAKEVFERAAGHANDVGLLSEQVESGSGELLGNFPQAFSHIGLVNAAWTIAEAEREAGR
ncbi:MAG TPA: glycoside hydrolase family 15 protein [Thermoanaerobaculia bacterium]|nr:glycoside hydrolase family 15 protein [Thermoanaerobaculia bacterium]